MTVAPLTARLLLKGLLALLAATLTPNATAAVQGTRGTTSTGSIDVTYTQGINVRIAGLADLSLGTWSGTGAMAADDNLCIGRSGVGLFGTGNYRILASGDGAPGNPAAFTLSNGVNRIAYDAYFNDQPGLGGRVPLTAGVMLTGQTSTGFRFFLNLLFGCAINNANISVVVPEAQLSAAAGAYAGTLTLMLIPE